MRPFGRFPFLCRQDDFEGVARSEFHWARRRQWFRGCQSGRLRSIIVVDRHEWLGRQAYFSLNPPPTPAPLPATLTEASVNDQDDAAQPV